MTHSEFNLQLARPADALIIALMSRDLIERGLGWRWTAARIAASIRAKNVNVLLARATDGAIAAFAIMRYGDDDAHLDLLAVAPRYQRRGIARQLLQWLEECAKVAGIFIIELEVRANNQAAQQFYRSMDYLPIVQLPGYYQGIETALRMRRDLTAKRASQEPAARAP